VSLRECTRRTSTRAGQIDEANARLIAAAPELLAALKALARIAEGDVFTALDEEEASQHRALSEAIDNADAVIARAEGQEKE